ncbi:MAG: isoleucine--tRNA ligase [Verrucomicrobia bacterium Tous-C9LFEB]|nr:MAG: isoleucine--tRNA ligase [Verrucomicrobia bacterium Tous-C9LFEB]
MDYKNTILLPKTDFPMRAELPKREPAFLEQWQKQDLYNQILKARANGPKFLLHDGPPFANGDAHIGHVLNMTLKDIVLKSKNMTGFYSPFIPGWDCHGLPIEHKVTKELNEKGEKTDDALVIRQKSEAMARKYIGIQREQFQRLGVFGEWDKPYLTLDPAYEAEELRNFAKLVDKDLVYQGMRPVSWSYGCQTALAEAEVEYQSKTDPAIFVKFPLTEASAAKFPGAGKLSLLIWTTTPWTLPANLAVAFSKAIPYVIVEHNGERLVVAATTLAAIPGLGAAKVVTENVAIEGLEYQHPFLDRKGKVYPADFVTADTGTGMVHIAPGHGQDDYILGRQVGLDVLSPVDDYGRLTAECGMPEWVGLNVFKANPLVIEHLEKTGYLVAKEDYTHEYPHCWRSKTPIVFRSVKQWFIKMDRIRLDVLTAIDRDVNWIPDWGRNRIHGTVSNRPDWCISRQRTWGVPIPVFYAEGEQPLISSAVINKFADIVEKEGTNVWFSSTADELAARLGLPAGLRKGKDTIDVWIDSGSSWTSVLLKRLEYFPADLYLEGSDQHRGWFNSSLCLAVAATGKAPYKNVLTHGFIVDETGKKYSKSSGATDLITLVNDSGADVLRLWVAGQDYRGDVPFSKNIFSRVSDVYRGIRNTLRILLGNLHDFNPATDSVAREQWTELDRYIYARLQEVIEKVCDGYKTYEFHRVYREISTFCNVELSSLYVDVLKDRMYCNAQNDSARRAAQTVMRATVEALVKLLAPLTPYTAEETWQFLGEKESVHLQLFPEAQVDCESGDFMLRWDGLLKHREAINQQLEGLRSQKVIGKSLEAKIELSQSSFESKDETLLTELLISSVVTVGAGQYIKVSKAPGQKCVRCWKCDEGDITDADGGHLCPRCAKVVGLIQ